MNRRKFVMGVGLLAAAVSVVLTSSLSEGQQSVTVLIAYHSATGNTEKMAQGVAEGAKAVPGTSVILKRVGEVAGSDLTATDALIVGSPVYFGNMSGEVKTFFTVGPSLTCSASARCATRSAPRLRRARQSPMAKNSPH